MPGTQDSAAFSTASQISRLLEGLSTEEDLFEEERKNDELFRRRRLPVACRCLDQRIPSPATSSSHSVRAIQRSLCAHLLLCNPSLPLWSWRRDLNPRPSDYKSDALPTELRQQYLETKNLLPDQSPLLNTTLRMIKRHSAGRFGA